ncbi:MAG: DUF1097 domain-containing protein [Absicoccus sp.]|uniref:DUF1097 domain-containing protein n=1 Tax=Absicoccus intestinalis TaxID=2926319 RepID=A0ABU4WKV5_9FIRM|nr:MULTISPECIES: DUF1097 domain-containing protein [unclassified Absicoccus]MDX8417183.1 DUF1097 domain-containing protein [Absicoccus sp. CLA-KB-P134]MDY3034660.1 DUF1097 domain-containing protein [Absicoccus sp.]
MKIERLDIVIAVLAGISCLGGLIKIPVWALFIGETWYFTLGSNPEAFKKSIPPMIEGYILAAIAILAYAASGFSMGVQVLTVIGTVIILMLSLKTKMFACSLASFNSYSCLFAGYYAGYFPKLDVVSFLDWKNLVIAMLWIALANVIGLFCGWLCIRLGASVTKEEKRISEN